MLGTTIENQSQVFNGIRFVLLGFDPIIKSQVSRKLVSGGGVNAGRYGPDCTHVIVDKLVYDDPVCTAARGDGKMVVSSLWVDHSFDVGAPVDATSIMYRPVRDLNGIPGAKSLVICLTGYRHEDREDIMTMVELMGAQFSKPLIANKVTHLVCYKFEGDKYLLAKKVKRIKLVNHRWLEECLKTWEIVPEAEYSKSGYELEMEAEAKDSEEEPEGDTARENERKIASPRHSLLSNQEVPKTISNAGASNVLSAKNHSENHEMKNKHIHSENFIDVTYGSSNLCEKPVRSPSTQNKMTSASTLANKSPQNEARSPLSAMRTTSPTVDMKSNTCSAKRLNNLNLSDAIDKSSSLVQKVNIETPMKGRASSSKDQQNVPFSGKRKIGTSCTSELQKISQNNDVKSLESSSQEFIDFLTEVCSVVNPHFNIPESKSLSSKGKNVIRNVPIAKTSTQATEDLDAVRRPEKKYKETSLATKFDRRDVGMVENVIWSPSAVSSDHQKLRNQDLEIKEHTGGSTSKSDRRKLISKKLSACSLTEKNTMNEKGSTFLNNSVPRNDDDNLFSYQKFGEVSQLAASGTERDLQANNGLQVGNMSGNKSSCMDDETEPPEDKDETNKEKHEDGEPENAADIVMEEKPEGDQVDQDQRNDENDPMSIKNKILVDKFDTENSEGEKTARENLSKGKKKAGLSVKKKQLMSVDNDKPETRDEPTPSSARRTRRNVNDLEKPIELQVPEAVCNDPDIDTANADLETEDIVNKKETKRNRRPPSKTKVSVSKVTDVTVVSKKGKRTSSRHDLEAQEEHMQTHVDDQSTGKKEVAKHGKEFPEKNLHKANTDVSKDDPVWFILAGNKGQRREFQQIIRRLKGRVCRVSHQWSYQATHFIVPDPVRRTEKFFAAAASGRWILKTDYLSASNQAGRFLAEEPYEWYKKGLTEDGQINLEAPRKWRPLKEKTGHGAFYGMRIIIYGECIAPPLDTLKRVVKAGDGTILATSPPYTRFLSTGVDFAVVSPGMPHVDVWVQEFLKHEIPCICADYLVEYVCKPGYPLEKHVQYDTNAWAERSYNRLKQRLEEEICEPRTPESDDVACEVCGSRDRGDVMLICGDESGLVGCGVGTHIDCCDPPFEDVPEEDWFCHKCSKKPKSKKGGKKKGSASRG